MRAPLPKTARVKPGRTATMPAERFPLTEKAHTQHPDKQGQAEQPHGYEATEKFMESIIKSQQAELITLHETTHTLKGELNASEQRTQFLKDIVKEFSASLAKSRADLRDLERHCNALQFEICCLENPTASPRDLKVRFDEEQRAQQERIRRHNSALADRRGGSLAATIGQELEARALATQLAEARAAVTHEFGAMASLNEEVAAIGRSARKLARENAALERDNAALQERIVIGDDGDANNIDNINKNNSSSSSSSSNDKDKDSKNPGGSIAGSSEPELLLEEDEAADDSESQHELSSAGTTRSSVSSEDIGSMCFPRKFPVHHELTELRARRLVSGGDLYSSYENIGPVLRK